MRNRHRERYRSGHNGPDSKSGSPHGLVGSNPTRSAIEKSSNHAGFWIFLFCVRSENHPVLSCSFHKFWKEQLFALFPAFFCVLFPSAAEIARFGKRHTTHHRLRRGQFRTVVQMGIDIRRGGYQESSHIEVLPGNFLLLTGLLVNQLVIDVDFTGLLAIFAGALVHRDKLDQLHAHLTGKLRHIHVGFQTADELVHIRLPLPCVRLPALQLRKLGFRCVLFRLILFQQADADWSYVKKKYKLNMPFLRLAYPAKASAFSSNAA